MSPYSPDWNRHSHLNRVRSLAKWLDSKFQGPFGFRFGLDPIIGLIPGIGDLITSLFSTYIIFASYKMGCSWPVLMRMFLNVIFENLMKIIPILGLIFDAIWKANNRNVALLEAHQIQPAAVRRSSVIFVLVVSFLMFALMAGIIYLSYLVFMALWGLLASTI